MILHLDSMPVLTHPFLLGLTRVAGLVAGWAALGDNVLQEVPEYPNGPAPQDHQVRGAIHEDV